MVLLATTAVEVLAATAIAWVTGGLRRVGFDQARIFCGAWHCIAVRHDARRMLYAVCPLQ